jgi:hypothetical protein
MTGKGSGRNLRMTAVQGRPVFPAKACLGKIWRVRATYTVSGFQFLIKKIEITIG